MPDQTHSPEDLFETLREEAVITVDEETDEVATTEDFESSRGVYYDTYTGISDEEFHESVADVFGLESAAVAADRVAELEISRSEFATYMTLKATLDGYTVEELTRMAQMVTDVGPSSPVPDELEHLDDDSYEAFVDENDRAIVTVWKLFCDPCTAMKERLDDVLAALPDDVAVAGLAGEDCPDFCATTDVNAAPAFVFFEDGEKVDAITGRTDPEPLAERAADTFER